MTFGGALFAAFPEAYATVFSGFYTAFMLLLLGLIFRAVSLEFRSKVAVAGLASVLGLGLLRRLGAGHAAVRRRGRQRHARHPARRARRLPRHGARSARPYPCWSGVDDRRAVRHARRDLPVPQDRGRGPGAAAGLDVALLGRLPGAASCSPPSPRSTWSSHARPPTSRRYPWAAVVRARDGARRWPTSRAVCTRAVAGQAFLSSCVGDRLPGRPVRRSRCSRTWSPPPTTRPTASRSTTRPRARRPSRSC